MPQTQAKQLEAINAAWTYFRANRTATHLAKMGLKAGHRVRKMKPTDGPAGRLLMELKVAIEQRAHDLKSPDVQTQSPHAQARQPGYKLNNNLDLPEPKRQKYAYVAKGGGDWLEETRVPQHMPFQHPFSVCQRMIGANQDVL